MKIAHISDLHLGKMLHGYSLAEDQAYIFNKIIEILKEQKVEVLLIAGDIYDKNIPSIEGIKLLRKFLNDLVRCKIKVLLISGNHDSDERLTFGSEFMEDKGIYFSDIYEGTAKCVTLEDEFGKVNFYLLPFIKPSTVKHYYPDEKIDGYEDAVKVAVKMMKINTEERNVIVSHQNIMNAKICESEEHIIGGLDAISADVYADFDYASLGHIHTPQKVAENVYYSGTPIKYSISELNSDKSMPIITLNKKGNTAIELIPLEMLRNIRELRGTFAEIIELSKTDPYNKQDFINIILTDEKTVPDAIIRLKSIYPNILQLSYDNTETNNEISVDSISDFKESNPLELFAEFYKSRMGSELDEEQQNYLQKLIEKIWGGEKCDL